MIDLELHEAQNACHGADRRVSFTYTRQAAYAAENRWFHSEAFVGVALLGLNSATVGTILTKWRRSMLTRRTAVRSIRHEAAEYAAQRLHPTQISNADETQQRDDILPDVGLNYIGNYSKGLAHPNPFDEVDRVAFRRLQHALASGDPDELENIPLGTPLGSRRKLVNPQAGLAFDLEGPDAHAVALPPAPSIGSAEAAGEMAELYWMALLRDVNFTAFGSQPDVAAAAASLSAFSDFRGPKVGGSVTPNTLFRGFTAGDLVGPYVSQFLLKPVTFGTLRFNQRQQTAIAGIDYLIDPAEWLAIQNGAKPTQTDQFDLVRRYIRNSRDLATYVHFDALYEAYLNACLILFDMQAPYDPGNPYSDSTIQDGFGTFGGPHILSLVTEVATRALKAVWYQKWFVHRRLRPEAFGGLVHHVKVNGAPYQLDLEILNDAPGTVLARIHNQNVAKGHNSFLLPQAFPEGSPLHPAYGAGHATVAGACVTILKAWFDESTPFDPATVAAPVPANPALLAKLQEARRPKIPNNPGTTLLNYVAPPGEPKMTVGGELNKVAANIAIGRNMAGVHWRSDYTESLKLGEAIAIGILEEQKLCYNERFNFTLTKFDGTAVTI
jgi:hypothetical protein